MPGKPFAVPSLTPGLVQVPLQVLVDRRRSIKGCLGPAPQKQQVVLEENQQFGYMLSEDPHDHKIHIYLSSKWDPCISDYLCGACAIDSLHFQEGEEREGEEVRRKG